MNMRNRTADEVMYTVAAASQSIKPENGGANSCDLTEGWWSSAVTQPHLVSWWPAYLGFQQAKYPPGILKYTAGQAEAQPASQPASREEGQQPGRGERGRARGRAASLDKLLSSTALRRQADWQHGRNVNLLESRFAWKTQLPSGDSQMKKEEKLTNAQKSHMVAVCFFCGRLPLFSHTSVLRSLLNERWG